MAAASTLGERLRQARRVYAAEKGREVRQADVAEAVGVTAVTVSRYESDLKEPSLEMLAKLGRALGVRPAWLAWGEPPMRPEGSEPDWEALIPEKPNAAEYAERNEALRRERGRVEDAEGKRRRRRA